MNEEALKSVIENLSNSLNMTDLQLYQDIFHDRTSILEQFFDNYVRKIEGMSCSHDKSVYIVSNINNYLLKGENRKLQETYGEYQSRGKSIGGIKELDKICYWCPKTIKDTQEAVSIIFNYICMNSKFFEERGLNNE